jgi:class 3 adenylate cyclase
VRAVRLALEQANAEIRRKITLIEVRPKIGSLLTLEDTEGVIFVIVGESIARNNGVLVKTVGDAVMASFASSQDAANSAFEAQAELQASSAVQLRLKAGVHVGTCLAVRLNERLDFFGGVVNTAARVLGLSGGNDVMVSDEVLAEIAAGKWESRRFRIENSFDARLRGLPELVRVHRLIGAASPSKALRPSLDLLSHD